MIGFAILMTGMETMSGAVKPLANVPEFTGILTMFSNPVLGMIAGAVLTAIIQSSSASIGILQALCATGAVNFSTALPIIMGQNIGTCVTAMLSGIGASKNAKRAALVHLYFNIIGTVIFMIVFYTINAVVHFSFLDTAASAMGIAVIHSSFNIAATIMLLPFGNGLVKLACLTIPEEKKEAPVQNQEKTRSAFSTSVSSTRRLLRLSSAVRRRSRWRSLHGNASSRRWICFTAMMTKRQPVWRPWKTLWTGMRMSLELTW